MAFGSKGRIEELEAENASLKQWVEYVKGTEPIQLAEQAQQYRSQLTGVEQQVLQARAQLAGTRNELAAARAPIVVTEAQALLQEVGIYEYRHPLDDAVAYKDQLAQTRDTLKTMARNNQADSRSRATRAYPNSPACTPNRRCPASCQTRSIVAWTMPAASSDTLSTEVWASSAICRIQACPAVMRRLVDTTSAVDRLTEPQAPRLEIWSRSQRTKPTAVSISSWEKARSRGNCMSTGIRRQELSSASRARTASRNSLPLRSLSTFPSM